MKAAVARRAWTQAACEFCGSSATVEMRMIFFCSECVLKLAEVAGVNVDRPLTMHGEVRAADPATVFRRRAP